MSIRVSNSAQNRKIHMHDLSNNIFNSESYRVVRVDKKRAFQIRDQNLSGSELKGNSIGIKSVQLPVEYRVEIPSSKSVDLDYMPQVEYVRNNNSNASDKKLDNYLNSNVLNQNFQHMSTEPIKNMNSNIVKGVQDNLPIKETLINQNVNPILKENINTAKNTNLKLPPKIPNYVNNRYDKINYYPTRNNVSAQMNISPSNNNANQYIMTEKTSPLDAQMVEKLYTRNYSASNLYDIGRQKPEDNNYNNLKQQSYEELFFYKNHNIYREKLLTKLEKQKKCQDMYIDQVLKFNERKKEDFVETLKKETNIRDEKEKDNLDRFSKQKGEMKSLHGKILEIQINEKRRLQEDGRLRKMISKDNLNNLVFYFNIL